MACFNQMNLSYQGRHPPSQLAALTAIATAYHQVKKPWFLDNGANNYVTIDLGNLSLWQ